MANNKLQINILVDVTDEKKIIKRNLKLRALVDTCDIYFLQEVINTKGNIYNDRSKIYIKDTAIIVDKSYDKMQEILTLENRKQIGFKFKNRKNERREIEKRKSSKQSKF